MDHHGKRILPKKVRVREGKETTRRQSTLRQWDRLGPGVQGVCKGAVQTVQTRDTGY